MVCPCFLSEGGAWQTLAIIGWSELWLLRIAHECEVWTPSYNKWWSLVWSPGCIVVQRFKAIATDEVKLTSTIWCVWWTCTTSVPSTSWVIGRTAGRHGVWLPCNKQAYYSETWITRTVGDHQTKFELWKVWVRSYALLFFSHVPTIVSPSREGTNYHWL